MDLPERPFLRIGAKYRLLGESSNPHWQNSDMGDDDGAVKRVVLNPSSSALYNKLCNGVNGTCNFVSIVTLDENLPCDTGTVECRIDTLQVVQVAPGVFYEYLRVPCTQLMYYKDAKKLSAGRGNYVNMCGKSTDAVLICWGMVSRYFRFLTFLNYLSLSPLPL